jgi:hypothetical protein
VNCNLFVVLKNQKYVFYLFLQNLNDFFLLRAVFGVENDLDKKKYICFLPKVTGSIFFIRNLCYLWKIAQRIYGKNTQFNEYLKNCSIF